MKYQLGQLIYYMRHNTIHSAPVMSRTVVENLKDDWACNEPQKRLYEAFGKAGTFYNTCHGIIKESDAFESKEALAAALIG